MKKFWIGLLLGVVMSLPIGEARNYIYADIPIRYAMSGWVEDAESRTWTYVSADAPSYVLSVDEDITDIISENIKIRLKQNAGTYVYGGITKVELSGSNTLVTVYGGTDYTFANEPISNVAFSNVKAPYGFPLDEDKWSVVMEDATDRTTTTFSSVVQVHSSHSINLPIGDWKVEWQAYASWTGVTSNMNVNVGLSTSSTAFSDLDYVRGIQTGSVGDVTPVSLNLEMNPKFISVTSKTPYYLVGSFVATGTSWSLFGATYAPTIIRAVWAGL